ncbi:MAG: spore maturation protein A [Clostridia bacterium]|nr:spore maturation protein A [Clostridia bacterium]
MIGKIFSVIAFISFLIACITNNMESLCQGIIDGASKSVSVTFSLMGMMALWSGIMNVLKESGCIKILSKVLSPILKKIFPDSFSKGVAKEEITACVSANLLGISNAATPLGIKAMKELSKNSTDTIASNDMVTLCVMGCACFNLVPTTVLALRTAHGAQITYEIIVPVWICSGACMIFAVLLSKLLGRRNDNS